MKIHLLALCGLTAAALVGAGSDQAQAMNLLVAVGNPQVQLVLAEDGSLAIVEKAIQVSAVEPAAGAQDTTITK